MLLSSLLSFAGGVIWIWKGIELSILPPGNPEFGYYRSSHFTIMPWLGFGLACIGIGLIGLNLLLAKPGPFTRGSFVAALIGCILYFFGTVIRLSMDLSNNYEFTQPIGIILAILGLLLFSLNLLVKKLLPLTCRLLLLIGAISLAFFNDQFTTSWTALPFGLCWIGLSVYLFVKFLKFSPNP
jgi:hypothetical protein